MDKNSISVEYVVLPARRRGRALGKYRRGGEQRGLLIVRDRTDNELRRSVRVAELHCTRLGIELLPTLFDVQIVQMSPRLIVLTGWERLPDNSGDTQAYGQSWWARPINPSAE